MRPEERGGGQQFWVAVVALTERWKLELEDVDAVKELARMGWGTLLRAKN